MIGTNMSIKGFCKIKRDSDEKNKITLNRR